MAVGNAEAVQESGNGYYFHMLLIASQLCAINTFFPAGYNWGTKWTHFED